jgi:hypothetical protein
MVGERMGKRRPCRALACPRGHMVQREFALSIVQMDLRLILARRINVEDPPVVIRPMRADDKRRKAEDQGPR